MSLNKGLKEIELEEGVSRNILPVKQQPVRTTFCLSKEAHDAIKHVSKLYSINNIKVFEMIVPLFQELKNKDDSLSPNPEIREGIRKTYLINKSALLSIERAAKEEKVSRDSFVDFMALALKFFSDKRFSKEKLRYEKVLKKIINPFWEKAEEIEKSLKKELGKDDPLTSGFGIVIINIMNLATAIEDNINEGTPIEKNFP